MTLWVSGEIRTPKPGPFAGVTPTMERMLPPGSVSASRMWRTDCSPASRVERRVVQDRFALLLPRYGLGRVLEVRALPGRRANDTAQPVIICQRLAGAASDGPHATVGDVVQNDAVVVDAKHRLLERAQLAIRSRERGDDARPALAALRGAAPDYRPSHRTRSRRVAPASQASRSGPSQACSGVLQSEAPNRARYSRRLSPSLRRGRTGASATPAAGVMSCVVTPEKGKYTAAYARSRG